MTKLAIAGAVLAFALIPASAQARLIAEKVPATEQENVAGIRGSIPVAQAAEACSRSWLGERGRLVEREGVQPCRLKAAGPGRHAAREIRAIEARIRRLDDRYAA